MELKTYLNRLASDLPAPGGGAAGAISGCQGVCLMLMVINLSLNNKKYAKYYEKNLKIKTYLQKAKDRLFDQIKKDQVYFLPLSECYKLPNNSEEEKLDKKKLLNKASILACSSPIITIKIIDSSLNFLSTLKRTTTKLAVSDLAIAADLLRTSVNAAWINILINLKSITDSKFLEEMKVLNNRVNKINKKLENFSTKIKEELNDSRV